jgi:hypothetical protein
MVKMREGSERRELRRRAMSLIHRVRSDEKDVRRTTREEREAGDAEEAAVCL